MLKVLAIALLAATAASATPSYSLTFEYALKNRDHHDVVVAANQHNSDDDNVLDIITNSNNATFQHLLSKILEERGGDDDEMEEFLERLQEEVDEDDDDNEDGSSKMLSTNYYYRQQQQSSVLALRGGGGAPFSLSDKVQNEMTRRLIVAAVVTLLYEGSLGHILEFLKIVMQTSPLGTTYGQVIRQITADKGLGGLWDGFIPWGVIQAVAKGGVFGLAHAVAKKHLLKFSDSNNIPETLALTLAGGIAGGFQGYVLSPTLLLKTRVMTDPVFRESMSLLRTTVLSMTIGFDVIRKEGLSAIMKGSNIFALKRVFDWATRFFFSDLIQSIWVSQNGGIALNAKQKIIADLLGGFFSTVSTLPLDVLVAKTQDAKKAGVKTSALQMFLDEYRQGGLKGLKESYLQGFEARLAHVCFTTVAMKTGTGVMYDYLFKNP